MSQAAWRDLLRVQPLGQRDRQADDRHGSLGRDRKWSLPTDGYRRTARDYVLLKRKVLIDAGWPREALLITGGARQEG